MIQKFPLFVRDGGKFKPSRPLVTVFAAFGILTILGLQSLSLFGPLQTNVPAAVDPPRMNLDASLKPPDVSSRLAAERAERVREKSRQLQSVIYQPLKSVSLGGKSEIPIGSEVSATLSSGGSNGTVTARLDAYLEADGESLLPKGTLLYGKGSSSEDRLYIAFTNAILPDKTKLRINAQAFDQNDRMEGLKGKKISDYAFKLATSAGLFFLGGLADGMRDDNYSNPFAQKRTNVKDAALNGVSTATLETGKDMLQKMNEEKARIEVKATTRIFVIFGENENEHK